MRPAGRVTAGGAVRYFTKDDPTAVYRFYGIDDRLLYVGIAHDPSKRWKAHSRTKWWARVGRKTVEWYPNRAEAEREERRAIAAEHPLLNTAGSSSKPDKPIRPGGPDVASYWEIANYLKVSRQRAREIAEKHPDFPRPIARLAMGPLFLMDSVKKFADGWERRPGRPRKTS